MDCYKVLRVNPGASSDEIIKAANKMLGIWNPNDYDEFRDVALCVVDDIVRARRILLDPERRKQHDEQRNVTISKLNHQNRDHTVEIASYSGLRGFYNKPWDCTSEHVTCASEDESPKYNFEAQDSSSETEPQVIIVDGSVKYLSSPKHAKDNKRTDFLRFSTSTPEYEINYDVKNFGNSSSISFNSMNSMKHTGTTDSQKEIEPESDISIETRLDTSNINTDRTKQTSESGSAKISGNFTETKSDSDFEAEHKKQLEFYNKLINTENFKNMEDQQLRETEYNVLENDLTTNTSILAKQPNDEIHEIKHFHCLPRTSNSKKSFNFYGNAKFTIPTPDLNSFSAIDKNFKSFPSSSESRNVSANDTDEAKDDLLRAYLGDTLKYKSFNNMGENFQCIKVENGKFIESNRNSQIMHPFTSGGKTDFNYNQLRSKALSDHVGSDYKKGIEPLNNPESNKLINRNSSEPFIVGKESDPNHLAMTPEDALSMKVNVSIQSLKEKESEMNKDSTLIEGLTSNKNIVCYCNLDSPVGNVRNLSTQNVWPGTFKSEELVLPNGNILKCESLLQAETFSDVSYIRNSNVKGLVKVSYAEENFLKRLTVVAQLEGRGLMTRYSFNDRDEKIEVYADGVWECKLMNGTAVDIAKSKEQHKSLEVPLYIKTMVYANNVNIKTLRSIGIPGNPIQLYKNDELLYEI